MASSDRSYDRSCHPPCLSGEGRLALDAGAGRFCRYMGCASRCSPYLDGPCSGGEQADYFVQKTGGFSAPAKALDSFFELNGKLGFEAVTVQAACALMWIILGRAVIQVQPRGTLLTLQRTA